MISRTLWCRSWPINMPNNVQGLMVSTLISQSAIALSRVLWCRLRQATGICLTLSTALWCQPWKQHFLSAFACLCASLLSFATQGQFTGKSHFLGLPQWRQAWFSFQCHNQNLRFQDLSIRRSPLLVQLVLGRHIRSLLHLYHSIKNSLDLRQGCRFCLWLLVWLLCLTAEP